MKLSNHLDADDYKVKNLAEATGPDDAVPLAQMEAALEDKAFAALPYAPGSITLPTETGRLQVMRLQLTGAQRLTVEGTGRMAVIG